MSEREDLIADLLALAEAAGASRVSSAEIDQLLASWGAMLAAPDYLDRLDEDLRFWLDARGRLQSAFDPGDAVMKPGWTTLQVLPAQEVLDAFRPPLEPEA